MIKLLEKVNVLYIDIIVIAILGAMMFLPSVLVPIILGYIMPCNIFLLLTSLLITLPIIMNSRFIFFRLFKNLRKLYA